MEKLNVRNIAGLVRFAIKYRLVDGTCEAIAKMGGNPQWR
jgi:hypothetical protein